MPKHISWATYIYMIWITPDWNPGLEVNHIDGNRDNNRADNLEMCTHQRNMEHAIAYG